MNALIGNAALETWLRGRSNGRRGLGRARREALGRRDPGKLGPRRPGRRDALAARLPPRCRGHDRESRSRREEHALLSTAYAAGVAVIRPDRLLRGRSVAGGPRALVERVSGRLRSKSVREVTLGGDRAALGRDLGRQLARIHAISPNAALAALLGPSPPTRRGPKSRDCASARRDGRGPAGPRMGAALGRAPRARASDVVLTHQDFRTGTELRQALVEGDLMSTLVNHAVARQAEFNKAAVQSINSIATKPPKGMRFVPDDGDRRQARLPPLLRIQDFPCGRCPSRNCRASSTGRATCC